MAESSLTIIRQTSEEVDTSKLGDSVEGTKVFINSHGLNRWMMPFENDQRFFAVVAPLFLLIEYLDQSVKGHSEKIAARSIRMNSLNEQSMCIHFFD